MRRVTGTRMTASKTALPKMEFRPVTPDRWADIEELFGPRGACGGCWCMYWRQTRSEYEKFKGETNRLALQALVKSADVPGLIAYAQSTAETAPALRARWLS